MPPLRLYIAIPSCFLNISKVILGCLGSIYSLDSVSLLDLKCHTSSVSHLVLKILVGFLNLICILGYGWCLLILLPMSLKACYMFYTIWSDLRILFEVILVWITFIVWEFIVLFFSLFSFRFLEHCIHSDLFLRPI